MVVRAAWVGAGGVEALLRGPAASTMGDAPLRHCNSVTTSLQVAVDDCGRGPMRTSSSITISRAAAVATAAGGCQSLEAMVKVEAKMPHGRCSLLVAGQSAYVPQEKATAVTGS